MPNAAVLNAWVERTGWVEHLAVDPATRSNTSVCLKLTGDQTSPDLPKAMVGLLDGEGAAFDIGAYRDAPPGPAHLVWCNR